LRAMPQSQAKPAGKVKMGVVPAMRKARTWRGSGLACIVG
jgi:hypothetical protein